ncbi:hypothetical protein NCCP2222_37470 [Sporosarcina sp. NCCP-2222]|uniref:helix-turn-helix domain-containing protein n=1 Tax=Sporosarcina sp. NCCP-2222 TaxID=2935073 RepID=UPI00207F9711|nr:hypothetical protein NCCP2222_37470 [Sporosarcina sp. NCCP-2222]
MEIDLKGLREVGGLTQVEVSEGILSNSYYSYIERGRFKPLNSTLELLANRLKDYTY